MIGVDIADHSIKIVYLSNDRPQRYLAHCTTPMPEGVMHKGVVLQAELLRKTLLNALLKCRIRGKVNDAFVFSIPETQTFLRVIEIPVMADDEIDEAIKWEVASHIPLGLENMYIDWQPITFGTHASGKERQEIQVGAAQKKIVDTFYAAIAPLGLDIAAFELESQSITRSLISHELHDKQGVVIVDLGGTATNIIVHDHGALRFTATLEKGIDDMLATLSEEEQALLLKGMESLSEDVKQVISPKLAAVTDELASEVLSIAEFYGSIDTNHVVREVILTGGGANIPSLDKAFLKHFDNIHVQRGNPWVNLLRGHQNVRPPIDLKESVRYSTALGLAMRSVIR